MRALSIETLDICPWALREGLILRKLDSEADGTALVETSVRDARGQDVDRNAANRSRGKQTMTGPHSETENPDTQQISVAELLARNGTIGAPAVSRRRRRRRGDSDAVTVAELTGEIPIIRDDHHDEPRRPPSIRRRLPSRQSARARPGESRLPNRPLNPLPDQPAPSEPVAEQDTEGDGPSRRTGPSPNRAGPSRQPQARRTSGPERSEYPRPLRHSDDKRAADGAGPGAEHMSPDPVGHYGDISVDVMDTERPRGRAGRRGFGVRAFLPAGFGRDAVRRADARR